MFQHKKKHGCASKFQHTQKHVNESMFPHKFLNMLIRGCVCNQLSMKIHESASKLLRKMIHDHECMLIPGYVRMYQAMGLRGSEGNAKRENVRKKPRGIE